MENCDPTCVVKPEGEEKATLRKKLEKESGGEVFNTDQLRENFEVRSFLAPWVIVTRKCDGVKGTLEFTHMPRLYFKFIAD